MENSNNASDFIMYGEWWPAISMLSDGQRGVLLHALFAACAGCCEMPKLDEQTKVIFLLIKPRILAAQEKYSARKKASAENGKLGGRPPKTVENKNLETYRLSGLQDETLIYVLDNSNINPPLTPPSGGSVSLFNLDSAERDSVQGTCRSEGNTTDTGSQPKEGKQATKAKRKPKGADLPPYTVEFESCWTAYPNKSGKAPAWKAFHELDALGEIPGDILSRIQNRALEPDWLENSKDPSRKRFTPHMATWLHRRGWEDEGCFADSAPETTAEEEKRIEIMGKYNFGMPLPGENADEIHAKNARMELELNAAGL